jgi:hypothetical protein
MHHICNNIEKFLNDLQKIENKINLLDTDCNYCKFLFGGKGLKLSKDWQRDFSKIRKTCIGYGEWLITVFNKRKQFTLDNIKNLRGEI